jgi:hypothetical protein
MLSIPSAHACVPSDVAVHRDEVVSPEAGAVSTEVSPAPVLVAEGQVVFSTAAAVASPRPKSHRLLRAFHAVAGALRHDFATTAERPHRERRHYPPRSSSYFERSAISREMYRL